MSKEYQAMINAAENGKVIAQPGTWDRIAPRLDALDKDQQIRSLSIQKKLLAIASCILLGVVVLLTTTMDESTIIDQNALSQIEPSNHAIHNNYSVHKMHRIYQ